MHRRLRPECFAGRIEAHVSERKTYDIHPDILNCDVIGRVKAAHGSCLLPVAFPEGCPTHPSYAAAHATNAGACATVLKAFFNEAFFNEDYPIPHPVEAASDGSDLMPWKGEPLTLGNEMVVDSPATLVCQSAMAMLIRRARLRASCDIRATPSRKYSIQSSHAACSQ